MTVVAGNPAVVIKEVGPEVIALTQNVCASRHVNRSLCVLRSALMKRKRIVVMGFMGSCPIAGVIWQHIHYIVGLQRLGHDVYYVEDSARLPYNPETFEVNNEFDYAAQDARASGPGIRFRKSLGFLRALSARRIPTVGLSLKKIRQLYRDADAILNICGTQEFNDDLLTNDRILYVESDPGVEQIKSRPGIKVDHQLSETASRLVHLRRKRRHDAFPVPTHKLKWLPTRQPVVTDLWKTNRASGPGAVFTSVANWSTSGLKDIEWRGEKYLWSKSTRVSPLCRCAEKSGETFELATDIKDAKMRASFERNGWRLSSPLQLSVDYWLYRDLHPASRKESSRWRRISMSGSTPGGSAIAALVTWPRAVLLSPRKPASPSITGQTADCLLSTR